MKLFKFPSYRQVIDHFLKKGLSRREIAFGVAVGNFVGILPILGLHTVLGIVVAYIFRLNQMIVFLGAQVSNPISFPFILFISAQLGYLILHGSFLPFKFKEVNVIDTYLIPTVLGSVIIGLATGCVSYFIITRLIKEKTE